MHIHLLRRSIVTYLEILCREDEVKERVFQSDFTGGLDLREHYHNKKWKKFNWVCCYINEGQREEFKYIQT